MLQNVNIYGQGWSYAWTDKGIEILPDWQTDQKQLISIKITKDYFIHVPYLIYEMFKERQQKENLPY